MQLLPLLRLQQLADSAFPIGSAAHSFGIETLVEAGLLKVESLEQFLGDYLEESGVLEAAYCAASCTLASSGPASSEALRTNLESCNVNSQTNRESAAIPSANSTIIREWLAWNVELGARKLARESREGSAAMGRRFLRLAASMSGDPLLTEAFQAASASGAATHLAACFGLAAGAMGINAATAAAACLQQSTTALVSACQRLLPLGQTQAHQILWNLKPVILRASEHALAPPLAELTCFTPLLDIAAARHATMYTRLFMS